jgi:molybdopterin synthase catalytic subunit
VNVNVRYFAVIREIVGRSAEVRRVTEGTTAGALFDELVTQYPRLERLKPVTMLMVNQQYVDAGRQLRQDDEVALIPPVSGGECRRFRVQSGPLDARELEALVAHPGGGAIATFIGAVRNRGRGKIVTHLEYEAYAPAAELALVQIGEEIAAKWGIEHVSIAHRTGVLQVGEVSVVISVASAHRDAAFDACRYAIERIKEIVPIWKKEHYLDGASWIGSELDYQIETGRLPRSDTAGFGVGSAAVAET